MNLTFRFKLKLAKLFLMMDLPVKMITKVTGVSKTKVYSLRKAKNK